MELENEEAIFQNISNVNNNFVWFSYLASQPLQRILKKVERLDKQ